MIERKALKTLLGWKNRQNRQTVLLIGGGAHRVGKSTLAQEFGRAHYKSTLTIDFSTVTEEFKSLFLELRMDIERLYQYLSAVFQVPLYSKESLLIFDEVQINSAGFPCIHAGEECGSKTPKLFFGEAGNK